MSMDINFDATVIPPSTGEYEPIPNDRYLLQVVDGEMKNKPEEGKQGASIKFQVADGEHQGSTFFVYYNLQHPNATAQRIGQGEFSALCHATGVLQPRNLIAFAAIPLYADVKVTAPRRGADGKEYGPGNTITKYYKADGSTVGGNTVGAPATVPTQAQPKKAAPAWVTGAKAAA